MWFLSKDLWPLNHWRRSPSLVLIWIIVVLFYEYYFNELFLKYSKQRLELIHCCWLMQILTYQAFAVIFILTEIVERDLTSIYYWYISQSMTEFLMTLQTGFGIDVMFWTLHSSVFPGCKTSIIIIILSLSSVRSVTQRIFISTTAPKR